MNEDLKTGLLIPPTHIEMQVSTFFLSYLLFLRSEAEGEYVEREGKKIWRGGKFEIGIQKYHEKCFWYFKSGLTKKH